jgi:hypothetical protein
MWVLKAILRIRKTSWIIVVNPQIILYQKILKIIFNLA